MGSEVYYEPKKVGLSIVATLDEANLSYEFNMVCVFRHEESGRLFWAQSAG